MSELLVRAESVHVGYKPQFVYATTVTGEYVILAYNELIAVIDKDWTLHLRAKTNNNPITQERMWATVYTIAAENRPSSVQSVLELSEREWDAYINLLTIKEFA